jgi:hypothetical protein
MPPFWLSIIAKAHIFLSLIAAGWVAADIFVVGRRQKMKIMEAVWPLTMLYFGPIGAISYCWFGRTPSISRNEGVVRKKSMWQATFTGATHCGAGCALGDFLGDSLAFLLGFNLRFSVRTSRQRSYWVSRLHMHSASCSSIFLWHPCVVLGFGRASSQPSKLTPFR